MADEKTAIPVVGSATSVSADSNNIGYGDCLPAVPAEQGDEYAGQTGLGEAVVPKGQLKRTFTTRHVQMIALGANIGSGVYISSGKALRYGSAPGMLIGCKCTISVIFPAPPISIGALGSAFGFCEWFGALTVVAAEGAVVPIVISYWNSRVPDAAWYTTYLVVVLGQHVLPNRVFAEFEFFTGALKVTITFIVLFVMLIISCDFGGDAIDRGYNYEALSAFPNGFKGIAIVFLLAAWATGGQEIIGNSTGEAKFPRWELPRACKNLFI
ncbi:amino acid permease-domain-containing protein [Xylariales sp. AK1849]|nr:amino acid permease-domain-containing protein [Xylariales sp. AK1849]